MGSNQPSDPFEEQRKQRLEQEAVNREKSHRSQMEFYNSVGQGTQTPTIPPIINNVPKPPNPAATSTGIAQETKSGGAGGWVVLGCIVAAIIAHLNYGVNSGKDYAIVVAVTALAVWIVYAMRETLAFVIKVALGIGLVLLLIRIFAHK